MLLALVLLAGTAAAARSHLRVVRASAHRVYHARTFARHQLRAKAAGAAVVPRVVRFRSPAGADPGASLSGAQALRMSAAQTASVSVKAPPTGTVLHGFSGVTDLLSDSLNGFPLTPPDQGLCVGPDPLLNGHPAAVWEPVNLAALETSPSGQPLRAAVSLAALFHDPYAEGDPRCFYDPSTASFYFTEIGFPVATGPNSTLTNTTLDVTVLNAHGIASYQFDTSMGGHCLGDQPKTGYDNNALVVSTDEYCGPTLSEYRGAIVLVLSKADLVAEAARVREAVLGPVALQDNPVVGLDPAINTGEGTEYLVNSVAFLPNGAPNPVGHTLGLWTLSGDSSVNTGVGTPSLSSRVLSSEPYAFPVPAPSTGTGATWRLDDRTITSEAALNPDDSRLSGPVNVTHGANGHVVLWTALDDAVVPSGDPATRDGAAWFSIDATAQTLTGQGYVAAPDASLLYPAVQAGASGRVVMVFSITGPTLNPSAAYTVLGSGQISVVALGAGPHDSFSDVAPYFSPRWGDYSFTALDPVTGDVWLGTEYIPPKTSWDPYDNWGTYVFEVAP